MSKTCEFPIKRNFSRIPPEFYCYGFDLKKPEFKQLLHAGCCCMIAVATPAGYELIRGKKSEPDHIDLFFIESGSIMIKTPEKSLRAMPHQLLIVNSWTDRLLYQDEYSKHMYFRFDNPQSYPQINNVEARNSPSVEQIVFYSRMLQEQDRPRQRDNTYQRDLGELLYLLIQRELNSGTVNSSVEKLDRFREIIYDPERRDFDVLGIAKKNGMSFSSFRKFCFTHFAQSPRGVIEDARMDRARGLLDSGSLSIEEISELLGYADRYTFTKAFSRKMGMAPGQFQNRFKP